METWQFLGVGTISLLVAVLIVLTRHWHARWTSDFAGSGVQKHHAGSPPRVGIVPIIASLIPALYWMAQGNGVVSRQLQELMIGILLASLPVLSLGLAEDLTKKVSPRLRLMGACCSALLAIVLLDVLVVRVDIPLLDDVIRWLPLGVAATVFLVAGFTNAMNIVDGLNGLSGGLGVSMLIATAAAAAAVGDAVIVQLCILLAVTVGGFLLVNFPRGWIFLGDGAAYFLGFSMVQVWLLLVARNSDISVWFVVALAAHPTMETIFTMYRRKLSRGRGGAFTAADRLHLHSLVYRRTLRVARRWPLPGIWLPNAAASLMVLMFAAAPMAAALLAPESATWCAGVAVAYALAYLVWYRRLVGFGRAQLRPAVRAAARSSEAVAR